MVCDVGSGGYGYGMFLRAYVDMPINSSFCDCVTLHTTYMDVIAFANAFNVRSSGIFIE